MSHEENPVPESCCYEAKLVAGWGGHNPRMISQLALVAFRFLKWFPFKIALSAQCVEVRRIETGQTALYGFVGMGMGVGASLAVEMKGWSPVICCPGQCPTFADFTGMGRLTIVELAAVVGANVVYLDFGSPKGCRLYFENVLGIVLGLGLELGTFIGYYFRIR